MISHRRAGNGVPFCMLWNCGVTEQDTSRDGEGVFRSFGCFASLTYRSVVDFFSYFDDVIHRDTLGLMEARDQRTQHRVGGRAGTVDPAKHEWSPNFIPTSSVSCTNGRATNSALALLVPLTTWVSAYSNAHTRGYFNVRMEAAS